MRPLEFRAWDKTNNEWFMGGDAFDLNFSGSYGDFFFDNDHPTNMRDVELEWVQYTGLKDKNGKKIWEGDILSSVYPWNCGAVEFGEGFQGEPADGQYPYQGWHVGTQAFAGDDVSVIGNIHENPELLEGQ